MSAGTAIGVIQIVATANKRHDRTGVVRAKATLQPRL